MLIDRVVDPVSSGGYLGFTCPRCGLARYAKETQRTAKCFRCGCQIPLDRSKIKVLFKVRTAEEAIEAVKKYKEEARFRGLL